MDSDSLNVSERGHILKRFFERIILVYRCDLYHTKRQKQIRLLFYEKPNLFSNTLLLLYDYKCCRSNH